MSIDISIVIGTYNRCEQLKKALESIYTSSRNVSCAFELLVVDNNSTDATRQAVESFQDRFQGKLRYCFESSRGLNFARNHGIREAKGEIVVYTDDDVVVSDNWISSIYAFFKQYPDADAVGGKVLPFYPERSPQWVKKYQHLLIGAILVHDYGDVTKVYDRSTMPQFVGANMAFRKEVFADTGGFRTDVGVGTGTMGAETEFFNRLMKHNKKVYYCGTIILWHPVERRRMTLRFIAKWNIALGRYRFLVDAKGRTNPSLVHYFGVPRYLYRELIVQGISLLGAMFNGEEFIKRWIHLARTIGKYRAIRICHLNQGTVRKEET